MSGGAGGGGPSRLGLRIYLVTVVAVLATGVAVLLALALARDRREPVRRDVMHAVARDAAARVATQWGSAGAIQEVIGPLASALRVSVAVYGAGGEPVASAGEAMRPPLPPPPERERFTDRLGPGPPGAGGRERHVVSAVAPVVVAGAPVGFLVVAQQVPGGRPPPVLLVLVALALVGAGVAAVVLGGSLARPLDRLARTARALGAGDLAARTGISRADELGAVARAFDEMADRVGALLRSSTELMANVAHELRTPLARIRVALDLAAEGDADVARASLADIAEDLSELERLVDDVLASARLDLAGNGASSAGGAPPLRRARLDPAGVVRQAVERLGHRHPDRAVRLELGPDLPEVEADAVLLRRALDNLLDNARKYSAPASPIRVEAARRGADLVVEVSDRGEGIAAEELERVFSPFYRVDRSRARATGGVGLGLPLARRIAEAHGGTLTARSTPGEGTTLTLTIPGVR
ncbi:histidine kinase [Anaeromyxobacter dehalogenans 2CP-1]|uniref:histidine kinase n=1 Tax=Anaeromyxobacter dehalogenans (strain ATCC BAA-258 / DSM 21875 / 2CP-1) TaxID=455488 RepID=B8JG69_ANAD2|nr:HAMP domain-containing sensor histidine kinase [Anaeromyxobacter dehalogenans]ACL66472.1 histidine kinase [Anaeromyxobacter dehalogenans 2CP-1]